MIRVFFPPNQLEKADFHDLQSSAQNLLPGLRGSLMTYLQAVLSVLHRGSPRIGRAGSALAHHSVLRITTDCVSFCFVFSVFPKASSPPQYFWEVHSNAINMGLFTGLSRALSRLFELRCATARPHIFPAHFAQHASLLQERTDAPFTAPGAPL